MKFQKIILIKMIFFSFITKAQQFSYESKNNKVDFTITENILDSIKIYDNKKRCVLIQKTSDTVALNQSINLSKTKFIDKKTYSYNLLYRSRESLKTNKTKYLIHYIGYFEDGSQFDNSYIRKLPLEVDLENNYFLKSFVSAIKDLKPGDISFIKIKPKYGYGSKQAGNIPPNSTLFYLIQVL